MGSEDIGLANPLSVSVPGISASNVRISVSNGRIEQNRNGYFVYPNRVGVNSIVSVSAMIDGNLKQIGTTPFRVKRVPDPLATVGGKNAGLISRNELLAQQGVYAEIPDFDFEMKFTVTSFNISTTRQGFVVDKPTNGNRFDQDQIDLMKTLNPGSRLYIDNIVAKGEDGSTRNLSAISFKIR